MKHLKITTAFLAAFLLAALAGGEELSGAEREAWEMEEIYWQRLGDRDFEGFMELWHPDFVGWPASRKEPVGLAEFRGYVKEYVEGMPEEGIEFQPEPLAVDVFGDQALIFYTCSWPDGKGGRNEHRYTHLWVKEDGVWRIRGGMSANNR